MPITPFIGVRISWLMFARNSLLARLASSAAPRASRAACMARVISASASLSSVMSVDTATVPMSLIRRSLIWSQRPSLSCCTYGPVGLRYRATRAATHAVDPSDGVGHLAALGGGPDDLLERHAHQAVRAGGVRELAIPTVAEDEPVVPVVQREGFRDALDRFEEAGPAQTFGVGRGFQAAIDDA